MPEASKKPVKEVADPTTVSVEHHPIHTHKHRKHVDEYSNTLRKEPACASPYRAFTPKPLNVSFESQDDDEQIVLFVRKHVITNLGWILTAIVLVIMPFFLRFIPLIDFFPERFHLPLIGGWYLFTLGYILEKFLSWFFNVNILTDERIVDIDFYSLLYKRISSAKIDRVEDVSVDMSGFMATLVNYGTVDIQTAAEEREFSFELVPQPQKVAQVINELLLEEQQEELEGRVR